jgi:D-threo-aldose 1-dehydrogenase
MERIFIPGTDISISRFIFGTANLMRAGMFWHRQKLLHSAIDQGFSHFDTAPYYGFGMAERDLKPLLAKHHEVTVTTKVGIYSPGGETQSEPVIFLRKVSGKILPLLSRPTIDWSVSRAQKSLEGSLRRLGRERIELFLLHEPVVHLLDTHEWLAWLEAKVNEGLVGRFGLAISGRENLVAFLSGAPELTEVIQTFDSLENNEADVLKSYRRPFQITYGYVSAAKARGNKSSVADILKGALRRNREGAIIVSTKKPERVTQYAQLAMEIP